MLVPSFTAPLLRRPETLLQLITETPGDMADAALMMLTSSATNDYLEKIGAEAIGARHLSAKLGADGVMPDGTEVEIKPRKSKTPNATSCGVVNDDTPMKLKKSVESDPLLVVINATPESRINWAVVTRFKYWNNARYAKIVKNLGITASDGWTWSLAELPSEPSEITACLNDLVSRHQPQRYVRSSDLHLSVLLGIPREDRNIWVHPDVARGSLPKVIQQLL
uniref:Uncharacterized protein n=1 Tax=viral metagenome TaxID=1070528 RepID=A0A6C0AJJ4_9ZZZZ